MGVIGCIIGCMIEINTLKITQKILKYISEIDEFKGTWRALNTLAPDRLNALRHVATIESIGSSTRIEGSKLSDQDVEKLLLNLKIQRFDTRDEQEVAGYAEVMELLFESWSDINLTENYIKQLHRDLLKYSHKDARHRGEYKISSNNITALDKNGKQVGVVFETSLPFDTPKLMSEIILWTNRMLETKEIHPLLTISIFTVVFLEIHPFQDGNGRLSRVLTTLLLLRTGYVYVPYSSLESIIEKNKDNYYLALRRTQVTIRSKEPDWQPWVTYFLQILLEQSAVLTKKIEQERIILSNLPELSLQIMDYIKQRGRSSMTDMIALTGSNRNTLKGHFRELTRKGHLVLRGKGRNSWYELP